MADALLIRRPMADERINILYVEDAPALRSLVIAAFDPAHFHVVVAGGSPAAAFLALRQPFDLVVCGCAATARAMWELVDGRPTRIVVVGAIARDLLPPRVQALPLPTAEGLRDAALRNAR